MTVDCHLFKMLIQRYYDGELDPVAVSDYERHRSGCGDCRALDAEFAALFGALEIIPRLEPSEGFNARVMSRVDVSRYRVSAARRFAALFGGAWNQMPASVRVGTALVGSFLLLTRELPNMWNDLLDILGAVESYKVAGETLLNALQRSISALPVIYVLIPLAAFVLLLLLVRITRAIAKKGETHAGIF
jgi:anti-sigma factor RsiW